MDSERKMNPWGVLGQLAGSGALFGALLFLLGFLSLRAHFNMLGLPVDPATTYSEYLAAGVRLVVTSLLSGALLVLLSLPFVLFWSLALSRLRSKGTLARIRESWHRLSRRPLTLFVVNTSVLLAFGIALLPPLEYLDQTSLLFTERDALLSQRRTADGLAHLRQTYFVFQATCLASVLVSWWVVTRLNRGRREGKLFTAMVVTLVSGQLLLLPINYGVLMMSTDFSRVVEIDGAAVQGELFLLGFDLQGNRLLYDRTRRQVILLPVGNSRIILGNKENLFADVSFP